MASRYLQFINGDGIRKTIRLPGFTKKQVEAVKRHVLALNSAKIAHLPLDGETARWLAEIEDTLRKKLVKAGLLDDQERQRATLGSFLSAYSDNREALVASGNLNPDTLRIERVTWDTLVECFGADKKLLDFSEGDAEHFRHHLLTKGGRPAKRCGTETIVRKRKPLSEATTRKRCSIASKMFRTAVRQRLIPSNPFDTDAVPKANVATERKAFVKAKDAQKVLTGLPTTEWKLLFALSRWGGLRIGSEARLLAWNDIDWEQQRLLVHSPKTKRYAGHESRWVPIFPELGPVLTKRFSEAREGEVFVLPMLQGRSDASLRGPLLRAIKDADLKPWPRLWHSLRSTRQTELEDRFPSHVVCAWLGNSKAISRKHYLQVTDEHFQAATKRATEQSSGRNVKTTRRSAAQALQQRTAEKSKTEQGTTCDTT